MAGPIIFERDRGTIDVQGLFVGKNFTWNRAGGGRRKSKVPPFHSRRCRKMLPGIFVGENVRAVLMHPFVAVAVIKMPVGINEMFDGIGTQLCQSVGDLWPRGRVT